MKMSQAEFVALQNAQLAKIKRARLSSPHEAHDLSPCPKPKPIVCDEPLGEDKRKAQNTKRSIVRIKSFRRRLLDPDNIVGGSKFFLDSLRYSKLIRDDCESEITLEVSQIKVKTKAEERTEIEIL